MPTPAETMLEALATVENHERERALTHFWQRIRKDDRDHICAEDDIGERLDLWLSDDGRNLNSNNTQIIAEHLAGKMEDLKYPWREFECIVQRALEEVGWVVFAPSDFDPTSTDDEEFQEKIWDVHDARTKKKQAQKAA